MRKKIGIISLLTLISIIAIIPNSYGAISSKPTTVTDGSNVLVNKSVSDSYVLCQQMKSNGESLYGSTVDPHLATNKDWGAVSYLSNSIYGTNTEGKNTGTQITINGVKYYSTTGNASGVMNWGMNPYNTDLSTQTSSLIKAYVDGSKSNNNVIELKSAVTNNPKYVNIINTEEFNSENTLGMAMAETMNFSFVSVKAYSTSEDYPIAIRQGLFNFVTGARQYVPYRYITSDGAGNSHITFRPVVWN